MGRGGGGGGVRRGNGTRANENMLLFYQTDL